MLESPGAAWCKGKASSLTRSSEGLFVDYRYFDKQGIAPRFEFGFGLSYTTFNYSDLTLTPMKDKSALPAARPSPGATPPTFRSDIPDESEALWPPDDSIRRLDKYIYPYLDNVDELVGAPYPYPDGYNTPQSPSAAGGAEGGNPDLWETYVRVAVNVTNTGARAGLVVPQLYLGYPETGRKSLDFPVKVLRGFDKVQLAQGETRTVEFNVTRRDLSYWSVEHQNWVMLTGGHYTFEVGDSSRDLLAAAWW